MAAERPDPVGGLWGSKHVALTFEEADELRCRLNDFIALGREYAQPETVASPQELIDYCGVRIIESEFDAKRFWGMPWATRRRADRSG